MEGLLDNWLLKTNKEPIFSKKAIDERNLLYGIFDLYLRNIRSYYFAMNYEYKNMNQKSKFTFEQWIINWNVIH